MKQGLERCARRCFGPTTVGPNIFIKNKNKNETYIDTLHERRDDEVYNKSTNTVEIRPHYASRRKLSLW